MQDAEDDAKEKFKALQELLNAMKQSLGGPAEQEKKADTAGGEGGCSNDGGQTIVVPMRQEDKEQEEQAEDPRPPIAPWRRWHKRAAPTPSAPSSSSEILKPSPKTRLEPSPKTRLATPTLLAGCNSDAAGSNIAASNNADSNIAGSNSDAAGSNIAGSNIAASNSDAAGSNNADSNIAASNSDAAGSNNGAAGSDNADSNNGAADSNNASNDTAGQPPQPWRSSRMERRGKNHLWYQGFHRAKAQGQIYLKQWLKANPHPKTRKPPDASST
jgi:hypothetical protein